MRFVHSIRMMLIIVSASACTGSDQEWPGGKLDVEVTNETVNLYPNVEWPYIVAGQNGYFSNSDGSLFQDDAAEYTLLETDGSFHAIAEISSTGFTTLTRFENGFRRFSSRMEGDNLHIDISILSPDGSSTTWADVTESLITPEESAWANGFWLAGFSEDGNTVIAVLSQHDNSAEQPWTRKYFLLEFTGDDSFTVTRPESSEDFSHLAGIWSNFETEPSFAVETETADESDDYRIVRLENGVWTPSEEVQTPAVDFYNFSWPSRVLEHGGVAYMQWAEIESEVDTSVLLTKELHLDALVSRGNSSENRSWSLPRALDVVFIGNSLIGIRQDDLGYPSALVQYSRSGNEHVLYEFPVVSGMSTANWDAYLVKVDDTHFAADIAIYPENISAEGNGHITAFFTLSTL